jgi:hypothetical protein
MFNIRGLLGLICFAFAMPVIAQSQTWPNMAAG